MVKLAKKVSERIVVLFVISAMAIAGVFMTNMNAAHAESSYTNANTSQTAKDVLTYINKFRASKGLKPVKYSITMSRVSNDWSRKMATDKIFEHNPQAFTDARYPKGWTTGGEIIAARWDYSGEQLVNQWINSPGHNAIMSNPNATHVGIGIAYGQGPQTQDGKSVYRSYGTVNFFGYNNDLPALKSSNEVPLVRAGMASIWSALGSYYSGVGYPLGNEVGIKGGAYQQFENGRIYWKDSIGGRIILGAVAGKWYSLGAENSWMGYPTSNEILIKNGVFQTFEKGSIYWSERTGAQPVFGAVADKWYRIGAENSNLGYPTTSEIVINGGVYQQFQNGKIYWSEKTGAYPMFGAINNSWTAWGAEKSSLGYPTSAEYVSNGKVWQNFQNGKISWTEREGTAIVMTALI